MQSDKVWGGGFGGGFRPRPAVKTALFMLAPLFDALLLASAFGLFSLAKSQRPGVVVELPRGNADDGLRSSIMLVAKPQPFSAPAHAAENYAAPRGDAPAAVPTAGVLVFFNDEKFDLRQESSVSAFVNAAAAKIAAAGEADVTLYIDAAVPHGDSMALSRMLRAAGAERLCFALGAEPEKEPR